MQEEGKKNILGNSSGFLCASFNPDTPPFFLVRFSGFGRREVDKPSLSLSLYFAFPLSRSLSLPTGLGEI